MDVDDVNAYRYRQSTIARIRLCKRDSFTPAEMQQFGQLHYHMLGAIVPTTHCDMYVVYEEQMVFR